MDRQTLVFCLIALAGCSVRPVVESDTALSVTYCVTSNASPGPDELAGEHCAAEGLTAKRLVDHSTCFTSWGMLIGQRFSYECVRKP